MGNVMIQHLPEETDKNHE